MTTCFVVTTATLDAAVELTTMQRAQHIAMQRPVASNINLVAC